MSTSNNITEFTNSNAIKKSGTDNIFDINRIIRLIAKYWYLFLISFPLSLGSVFIYHRYTVPVYKASATLMLKGDDHNVMNKSELISGFGLSPEMRSIENQSFIIRSRQLIKKTIDRLDFGVSYYQEGRLKDTELYVNSPFYVEFDSVHPQILNVPIHVNFKGDKIEVVIISDGGSLHSFKAEQYAGSLEELNIRKTVKEGEWVTDKSFSFRIIRRPLINIADDVNYYITFKSHHQLTGEYRSSLSVAPYSEGSSILFISTIGTNTWKITRFLDELCDVVLEHNLDRKNDMATRSIEFIEKQLKLVSDTLDKVQNEMSSYRKANRFMGPSEFSQKLADQYYEKESELKMLDMRIEYYEYFKKNLETSSDVEQFMLTAVGNETTGLVNDLVKQLIELQKEHEMLMNSAHLNNQYVISVNNKIEVTVDLLNKAINQVLHNFELEKQTKKKEISAILADMDKLPELEKDYLIIDRTYKLNDAIYTFLLQKHSETQISKASNIPDNEIIDNASVVEVVSPDKDGNYKKGFMLALLIPIAFIVLKEFLNNKVRGKDDIEQLVPYVPILGAVVHNKSGIENVIQKQPHSVISESFRAIRTKLKFMAGAKELQVITLTSTNMGEGKTFCAQNLASVFGISGKRTVIVGFDLRKPRLSALYNMQDKDGLSNYYIGQARIQEIIYPTEQEHLSVIPTGPVPPNPSELIVGDKTEELFSYLRENFDIIIVDSPPIGLVADARMLMHHSDCNLFVVRANHTLKEHMQHAIENIYHDKVEGLGIVLNDIVNKKGGYGYYSAAYYDGKVEN